LLLGPGPSNLCPEVVEAPARPVLGHLDPEFLVLLEEGIEESWERHRAAGAALQAALPDLGFELLAEEGHRLPQLTLAGVPDGTEEGVLRSALLDRFGIEVGGGLGALAGKAWRIGLMGHCARESSVSSLMGALRVALSRAASRPLRCGP